MKYIIELNARPKTEETAEQKHNSVVNCLKYIESPWGLNKTAEIPFPGFGDDFTSIVNLNTHLHNSIKGTIFYRYRNALDDDSLCDDRIYLEFSTKKVDYQHFVLFVLKQYIDCFRPYYAAVYNEKVIFEDFEKTRFKNFRREIVRFCPVFFIDEELSFKALGLSIEDLKARLQNKVEKIDAFSGGLFCVYSSRPLTLQETNIAHQRIENEIKLS